MANITTRIVVRPFGGGELVEVFEADEPGELCLRHYVDHYRGFFGPPLAIACTTTDAGRLAVGWVFAVPEDFDGAALPAPPSFFEFVVLPLVPHPGHRGERVLAMPVDRRRRTRRLGGSPADAAVSGWLAGDLPHDLPVRHIDLQELCDFVCLPVR